MGSIRAVTLPSSRATHMSMPTVMSPVRAGTGIDTSRGSARDANARCHAAAIAPLRVVERLEPQDLPARVHGERELVAGERDEGRRVGQVADVVFPGRPARLEPE